jgi:cytochrome c553
MAMVVAVSGAQAAGDAEAGKAKSVTCLACHGPEGNSVNPIWPKLAGQHESYITKQLMDFRNDKRADPLMTTQAKILQSEQDVADLAAYFSAQTQSGGVADPEAAKAGEQLYRAGDSKRGIAACMACHGPAGDGNPEANFPRIAGQHAAYVEKALKDFRAGNRNNDTQRMMQGVVDKMSDDEIKAVAQYVQGLH